MPFANFMPPNVHIVRSGISKSGYERDGLLERARGGRLISTVSYLDGLTAKPEGGLDNKPEGGRYYGKC
jgi:hypothetical protein